MQLLIVHDDAEVGEQLMSMLKEYTAYRCDLVESDAAAHRWAAEHDRCGLLLAQLKGTGVDGLMLGGSLSEIFPGLQTFFLPAYPAGEQQLEIADPKIFPEPIDGSELCVLCQQPLSQEALERRSTFESFIKSSTKSDEERAARLYSEER
jgi:DNA-binding NtrC family response regulator